jgi:hypothetical protein
MLNDALAVLKSLESYGYTEREITIGEVKIKLAPLCSGETVEVFEASNKYEDTDASIQVLKIETLARSIISVNDHKFNPKKFVDEKREVILAFGDELIDIIFSEYCILDKTIVNSIERKGSSVISRLEIAETE